MRQVADRMPRLPPTPRISDKSAGRPEPEKFPGQTGGIHLHAPEQADRRAGIRMDRSGDAEIVSRRIRFPHDPQRNRHRSIPDAGNPGGQRAIRPRGEAHPAGSGQHLEPGKGTGRFSAHGPDAERRRTHRTGRDQTGRKKTVAPQHRRDSPHGAHPAVGRTLFHGGCLHQPYLAGQLSHGQYGGNRLRDSRGDLPDRRKCRSRHGRYRPHRGTGRLQRSSGGGTQHAATAKRTCPNPLPRPAARAETPCINRNIGTKTRFREP